MSAAPLAASRPLLIVCEPQCWGFEHAHFNASVLDTALHAHPDARVVFMGEAGHIQNVREVLDEYDPAVVRRVEWREVQIPPRQMLGWRRVKQEFGWAGQLLRDTDEARGDVIVLSSITATGIVALKALQYGSRKRVPVLAIVHSVLRTLFDKHSLRPSSWIVNLRHAVSLPHPAQLRYMTLAAPIYRNLVAAMPDAPSRFVNLDLPYLMQDLPAENGVDPRPDGKTRFGFLGVGNAVKRFDLFARLADDIGARVPNAATEFTLVGSLPGAAGNKQYASVTGIGTIGLRADEYRRRALELTYVVSTSEPDHYRFVASATFLDALALGKPGIFIRNPFLEHYFGLMGDIGYLCDSYDEMLETAEAIARDFPAQRYREQCRNIRRGRTHFTPQQLASQMRDITIQKANS